MSKMMIFVTGYSIFIIVLFVIFLYLVSTVHPEQLVIEEEKPEHEFVPPNIDRRKQVLKNTILLKDDVLFPDNYAKENVSRSNILMLPKVQAPHNQTRYQTVVPPLWPSSPVFNLSKSTETYTSFPKSGNKSILIKDFRRSISDLEHQNSESTDENIPVILQIIDDKGQSKIEIKLNTNNLTRDPMENTNPGIEIPDIEYESSSSRSILEPPKNTVIRIFPNDTFIVHQTNRKVLINIYSEKTDDDVSLKKFDSATPEVQKNNVGMEERNKSSEHDKSLKDKKKQELNLMNILKNAITESYSTIPPFFTENNVENNIHDLLEGSRKIRTNTI